GIRDFHVTGVQTCALPISQAPRTAGGLGGRLAYPLVSDLTHEISETYGTLWNHGHTLRGLFIIDKNFIVRHVTLNDDPVGRNIEDRKSVVQGDSAVIGKQ